MTYSTSDFIIGIKLINFPSMAITSVISSVNSSKTFLTPTVVYNLNKFDLLFLTLIK